jgi:hypothetical protein
MVKMYGVIAMVWLIWAEMEPMLFDVLSTLDAHHPCVVMGMGA